MYSPTQLRSEPPIYPFDNDSARLEAALVGTEIGAWIWEVREDVVRGDANLNRMFGVSFSAGVGRPIADYLTAIHPDDLATVSQAVDGAVAAGARTIMGLNTG